MKKTAIVIDSTVYMSAQDIVDHNLFVIPLTVNFEHTQFSENIEDVNQVMEVFRRISEQKKLPQTSQPATNEALELFQRLSEDGYDRVVCLHISSELSGTKQGMQLAASQYMEANGDLEIVVFDTLAAAQVSALVAKTVANIVKREGSIEDKQVNEIIAHYNQNTKIFVFVDNLDYLAYGGRIPATMASIGNLFGITPIITLNEKGGLEKYKSERSQKKAIFSILKLLEEQAFDMKTDLIIHGFYTSESKMAKKLVKEANKRTAANVIEAETSQMGIVISNHLGPKSFGLFWAIKYE